VNALWFTYGFAIVSLILINLVALRLRFFITGGVKGTNFFRTIFFIAPT
jgi:raffinose/stachyose/melibiose transport system permease protein